MTALNSALAFLVACMLALAAPPAAKAPAGNAPAAGPKHPNFVFIQAEAQGWSSTSVDMDGTPPSQARPADITPNVSKLAERGMRFSDFYVTAPRCTPSRASWVTGISPAKLHMTYQNEGPAKRDGESPYKLMRMIPPTAEQDLPAGVQTVGGLLRPAGYASAHFGKWHVGRKAPSSVGFDTCDGANSNGGPDNDREPNPKQCVAITDRGIEFMRAQVKAGKPFYLQMSHYAYGTERDVTPESWEAAKRVSPDANPKQLAQIAGARDVDVQVGRVLAAIKELGIEGSTYVFYGSDHGAQGGNGRSQSNPPFTGGKGSVSEGGIRIPFIADGPGIAAGKVCAVRATNMDLVPTLLDLAGVPAPKTETPDAVAAIEGTSLAGLLRSGGEGTLARRREETVIHFPHYDLSNGGPASAVYLGNWKLVRNYDTKKVSLYDIAKDRAESHDVAADHADVVKDLEARLDAYLKAVKAPMPTPNPDPAAANAPPGGGDTPHRPGGGGGGGKGGGKGGGGKGGKGGGNGGGGNGGGKDNAELEEETR